jgi:hypothetical protein
VGITYNYHIAQSSLKVENVTLSEGNDVYSSQLTITAAAASQADYQITVRVSDGAPIGFGTFPSGLDTTVTMKAGATQVELPFLLGGDTTPEFDENYVITAISSQSTATGLLTIRDDDIPEITVSSTSIQAIEGEPAGSVTLTLTEPAEYDISILVEPTSTSTGWEKEYWVTKELKIKAGDTSAKLEVTGLLDQELEYSIERGHINISAKGAGPDDGRVTFKAYGTSQPLTVEIKDRVMAGLEAPAVDSAVSIGGELVGNLLDAVSVVGAYANSVTKAKYAALAASKQFVDKIGSAALVANVAFNGIAIRQQLDEDLVAAGDSEHAIYKAYMRAFVNAGDAVIGTAIGLAAGQAVTAGVTIGALKALGVIAVATPAAIPVIGLGVVVGLGTAWTYQEVLAPHVRDGLQKIFMMYMDDVQDIQPPINSDEIHLGLDQGFYLDQYADVAAAGIDPLAHYTYFGWREGRDPNAAFSTDEYLMVNPDVRAAGVNPLAHYTSWGWQEARDPSLAFDNAGYLALHPDVKAAGVDPMTHYLQHGFDEGRETRKAVITPDADAFDAAFYLAKNADVAAAGVDAKEHFMAFGWQEGRDPNSYFDTSEYLQINWDVAAANVNPLLHYNEFGWREERTGGFDQEAYLEANADVAAAGVNPLLHFLHFGIFEGREFASVDLLA